MYPKLTPVWGEADQPEGWSHCRLYVVFMCTVGVWCSSISTVFCLHVLHWYKACKSALPVSIKVQLCCIPDLNTAAARCWKWGSNASPSLHSSSRCMCGVPAGPFEDFWTQPSNITQGKLLWGWWDMALDPLTLSAFIWPLLWPHGSLGTVHISAAPIIINP